MKNSMLPFSMGCVHVPRRGAWRHALFFVLALFSQAAVMAQTPGQLPLLIGTGGAGTS